MPQALPLTDDSVDDLTLPSVQHDFAEWRQGRRRYAVWALDVDVAPLRSRCAGYRSQLAEYLLPGYCRQPHITVHICGFPAAQIGRADDYAASTFAAQVRALSKARWSPFVVDIGRAASFSSAPYLSVADHAGGIANLRRSLAGDAAVDDFRYVPHASIGLYRGAFSLPGMLSRLAVLDFGEPLQLEIKQLCWMTYEAAVIGGSLSTLAEFDLLRGCLHVPDEQRLADSFGGVLPEQPFA